MAVTYKLYASRNLAFSFDVGRTANGLYNEYYSNVFMDYMRDSLKEGVSVQQLSHRVLSDLFLEGKLLYQWDAEQISKGLQVYTGAGWQWRSADIRYEYLYNDALTGASQVNIFNQTRFTYGPVAVLGFEYAYFSIPISAFIEVEWFYDVGLDPSYNRFQGGVGLRYVFR